MIFSRLSSLIGEESLEKLANKTVAIIGLGGVGAVTANTLARCGVGKFILMDFDVVEESNINRQIIANINTIGLAKTDLVAKQIEEINPKAEIIKLNFKYSDDFDIFKYKIDFLVDAIDDINAKFLLIKNTIKQKINFISSMGAARKLEPSKIVITELSKTTHDPLAKSLRLKMRENQIYDKIIVASSTEEAKSTKILGSYMPVTAYMGLLLADYVIKKLIEV